jgi:hypothetical protein
MWASTRTTIAAATLAVVGCAGVGEERVVRIKLEGLTELELKLPRGWAVEPAFSSGTRLSLLRLSAREPGQTQMWIRPLLAGPAPAAGAGERARRELAAGRDCDGIDATTREEPLGAGTVVFCTRGKGGPAPPALVPTTAGALALPGLVARFAMIGVTDEESAAAWTVLRSLRVDTVRYSP